MPKLRQSVQTQYGPVVQKPSLSQSLITFFPPDSFQAQVRPAIQWMGSHLIFLDIHHL